MGVYVKFHIYAEKLVNNKTAVRNNAFCLNRGQKGKKSKVIYSLQEHIQRAKAPCSFSLPYV